MENTRSNSPSISTTLDGIKAANITVDYGPDLPSDPEVVEHFNKLRPDAWSIVLPEGELNLQQREALAVFDNADNLREDPNYKTVTATACLLLEEETRRYSKQIATQAVDKGVSLGIISEEDKDRIIDRYARPDGEIVSTLRNRVFNDNLDESSLLYEHLQSGASSLSRLAILESLGFSEASVRGAISCGSIGTYERKKSESEEFFALTDEGRKDRLENILKEAEQTIKASRTDREKREQEAALKAANEKMFGDDLEGAARRIESDVESLQQDGYTLLCLSAKLMRSREKAELTTGSLGELRQAFPDLCYPSGLNALDHLTENYAADTEIAVLVGAQAMGTGKVYALGPNLATIYKKSDSSEG